jgi:hypothetical protein
MTAKEKYIKILELERLNRTTEELNRKNAEAQMSQEQYLRLKKDKLKKELGV